MLSDETTVALTGYATSKHKLIYFSDTVKNTQLVDDNIQLFHFFYVTNEVENAHNST